MRIRLLLLCVGVALALPAGAVASTVRYVSTTGKDSGACASSACKTIKYAIGQAVAGDTISIGPGTFEEGEIKVEGKALDFVGAGAGTASTYEPAYDTFIDGAKDSGATLTDTAGGSFSDFRIEGGVSAQFGDYGTLPALYLSAGSSGGSVSYTLEEIVATEPPAPTVPPIEELDSYPAVMFRDSSPATVTDTATVTGLTVSESESGLSAEGTTLTVSHSAFMGATPLRGVGLGIYEGSATVTETDTSGGNVGVGVTESSLTAARDDFAGSYEGLAVESLENSHPADATVRDSLIEALPTTGVDESAGAVVGADDRNGDAAHLLAVGSTLVGYGKGASAGLRLFAYTSGYTATARLANTIAYADDPTAPNAASDIFAEGSGVATVTAASSSFSTAKTEQGATITAPGSTGNIAGYPGFTNPAAGEFTLTSASPLLERGDPSQVESGELDLVGNPRIEGGCRSGHAPDIGAYELALGVACPSSAGSSPGGITNIPTKAAVAKPTISALSFSAPRRASRRGKHAKHAKGGLLTFTLDETATVKLVIERELTGYLRKRACIATAKSKSRPRSCKLITPLSSIEVSSKVGTNKVTIPNVKLLGHMKAGHYKLVVTAVSSGGVSAPQTVAFKLS
jgi:hypothetical protein